MGAFCPTPEKGSASEPHEETLTIPTTPLGTDDTVERGKGSARSFEEEIDKTPSALEPAAEPAPQPAADAAGHVAPPTSSEDDRRSLSKTGTKTFHRAASMVDDFATGKKRKVCQHGTKCFRRNPEHMKELSHPADSDYLNCCRECGVEPEFISVRSLFDWCDPNSSGKAKREELKKVWKKLQAMGQNIRDLSDDGEGDALWQTLDDDGNGYVNFSELAEFTTMHKVDLPLGLDSLIGSSSEATMRCGVHDCRCENFEVRRRRCKYKDGCYNKKEDHLKDFCHPKDRDWAKATEMRDDTMCRCGHKQRLHAASLVAGGAVPYPEYWTTPEQTSGDDEFNSLVDVSDSSKKMKFQELLNACYLDITTRDRQRHCGTWMVPRGFKLESVQRNENSKLWRKYIIRKAEMKNHKESHKPLSSEYPLYGDVLTEKAWRSSSAGADLVSIELDKDINEWYLFHGTSTSAARNICMNDFKMRLAGSATGTLYGKGTYLAESITKADEYSKEENGSFTVLLCRVLGGCVRYCDDRTPDPDALTKDCVEGQYDCILGDRQKIAGTYREFIIFDSETVYPEYVLKYKRGEFFKSASHPK